MSVARFILQEPADGAADVVSVGAMFLWSFRDTPYEEAFTRENDFRGDVLFFYCKDKILL